MNNIGPPLEKLLRRLIETPPDFLDEPRIGSAGKVFVAALVNDLMARRGKRLSKDALARFTSTNASVDRNRLALVVITVWVLADEWFASAALPFEAWLSLLDEAAAELASTTQAHKFVTDPDRREELVRTALARLGLRPEGETVAQATDRLSRISGTERERLINASRDNEKRAREIRAALAKKAAEESADKWTRE
jgi:hypothetical protein